MLKLIQITVLFFRYKASEETIEISLNANTDESIWCKNYFIPTSSPHLNVTLHNPLFGVFTNLLPGLVYHGKLNFFKNLVKVSLKKKSTKRQQEKR